MYKKNEKKIELIKVSDIISTKEISSTIFLEPAILTLSGEIIGLPTIVNPGAVIICIFGISLGFFCFSMEVYVFL